METDQRTYLMHKNSKMMLRLHWDAIETSALIMWIRQAFLWPTPCSIIDFVGPNFVWWSLCYALIAFCSFLKDANELNWTPLSSILESHWPAFCIESLKLWLKRKCRTWKFDPFDRYVIKSRTLLHYSD